MKRKKRIVLGIIACMMSCIFVGCEKAEEEESSFTHYEYSAEAAETRKYEISKEEAIKATAEAYYQKGALVQYDQTWTTRETNDYTLRASRWDNYAAPEMATSQHTLYLDCTKYQNCVYYNTFGYNLPAESTDNLLDFPELQVLYYEPTGNETEEEKQAVCDYVEDTIQIGDIVVYRNEEDTNGHAMLYVGDRILIHASSSGGGDYNYYDNATSGVVGKTDTLEPNGTVIKNDIKTLTVYTESRYLFSKYKFGFLRPMMNMTEADITQDAYCRAAFMQGIISEVTSDYPTGHTVEPGGVITYTLSIQNTDSVTRTVCVDLVAAEHTELLTESNVVEVEIATGATETVEFQVKVKEDVALGTMIEGPSVKGNGMTIATIGHEVNMNLADAESAAFASIDFAVDEVKDDFTMVQYAYKQATGKELPFGSVQEILWSLYEFDDYSNIALALKKDGIAREMLVEEHYGGLRVKNCGEEPGSRVANMTGANLQPGDILLVSEDLTAENTYLYLCTAPYNLLQWAPEYGGATLLRTGYMAPIMEALLGQKAYALLRPSFVLESDLKKVELDVANMDAYEGEVIVMDDVEWLDESIGKVEVLTIADGKTRVVSVKNPSQIPTERLMHMSVSKGYATFSTPKMAGLYDNVAADKLTTDIRRAAVVSFENDVLTYATDTGTGKVKIDSNTQIFHVSDEKQYGRLGQVEVGDTIPASAKVDGQTAQWNVIFQCDKNGNCDWIVVERSGLDISQCVGTPYILLDE